MTTVLLIAASLLLLATAAWSWRITLRQRAKVLLDGVHIRSRKVRSEDRLLEVRSERLHAGQAGRTPERDPLDLAPALRRFRRALQTDDDQQIAEAYDSMLDGHAKITAAERERLETARRCVEMPGLLRAAIAQDDDEETDRIFDSASVRPFTALTPNEERRVDLARRRVSALRALRRALASDDDDRVLASYDSILDRSSMVLAPERKRLGQARERVAALNRFRGALQSDDDDRILSEYDSILDGYRKITKSEWQRRRHARRNLANHGQGSSEPGDQGGAGDNGGDGPLSAMAEAVAPVVERRFSGEAALPRRVYQGDSHPIAVTLALALDENAAVPDGGPAIEDTDAGKQITLAVKTEFGVDTAIEIELLAAGIHVDGEKIQRQSITADRLSYLLNCYFPNSGDHRIVWPSGRSMWAAPDLLETSVTPSESSDWIISRSTKSGSMLRSQASAECFSGSPKRCAGWVRSENQALP